MDLAYGYEDFCIIFCSSIYIFYRSYSWHYLKIQVNDRFKKYHEQKDTNYFFDYIFTFIHLFWRIMQIIYSINPPPVSCICPQVIGYPCPTFCGYIPRKSFIFATILIAAGSIVTSFLISCFIFIMKNYDTK